MNILKMATDLFGQYFNNPSKTYLYTSMTCNGASADEISFDIVDGSGVISNNENTLSSIDLSDVHVGLDQYTSDMRILNPHELMYIRGVEQGSSYATKVFGVIDEKILNDKKWMFNTALVFHFKYVNEYGNKVVKCIKAEGSAEEDITIIERCQEIFDEAKIPVTVTYENGYIYFASTTIGFDFWISLIELWFTALITDPNDEETFLGEEKSNELGFGYDDEWSDGQLGRDESEGLIGTGNAYEDILTETEYRELYAKLLSKNPNPKAEVERIFLFEDLTKYVPAKKYRNGAMLGCVVKVTYPKFNADNITEPMRSLKLAHLVDRVEDFITSKQCYVAGLPAYVRVVRDVVDSYFSQYEFDIFNKWTSPKSHLNFNDEWIEPEEIPSVEFGPSDWEHSHVPNYYILNSIYKDAAKYEAIGLHGYANYLTKRNGWMTIGQLYARTAVPDDPASNTHNLIPSFLIYNPNNFPVTVNYMTFA